MRAVRYIVIDPITADIYIFKIDYELSMITLEEKGCDWRIAYRWDEDYAEIATPLGLLRVDRDDVTRMLSELERLITKCEVVAEVME